MILEITHDALSRLRKSSTTKRVTVTDTLVKGLSAELRPSGEGTWRYRFSQDSKQRCISLGLLSVMSCNEARSEAARIKMGLAKGQDLRTVASNYVAQRVCPYFKDFINELYLPHIRSYKRCVTADITLLDNHILPAFGEFRMNAINRQMILSFQQEKYASGYKPAYCNRFLVLLGFCFNLAIKWEVSGIEKNPVKLVSLLRVNNNVERFMTKEESSRLFQEVERSPNHMLRYFVLLALLTGMRKREILDAKWQDIDWERGLFLIPISKSGTARHVPLNSEALSVLLDLKMKLQQLINQGHLIDNPWVLPNPRTGMPYKSIFTSWATARKRAGLTNLRIHDLRHSFASALVNQGVPIYDVQKLLGHQDIKTTQRYAHFSMDRLRESSNVLNKFYDLKVNE